MCSKSDLSIWSSHASCAFEIGGKCNLTTHECDCVNGYYHDLFSIRQRDCSIPPYLMEFAFGVVMFGALCSVLYSFQHIHSSSGLSKIIIKATTVSQVFVLLSGIGYYYNGFAMNGILAFFGFVYNCFLIFTGYVIVYSLASPLFTMAQRSDKLLVITLKFFFTLFRTFQLSVVVAYCILYEDSNNPKYDKGASVLSAISLGLYGVEASIISSHVWFIGRRMIIVIEHLIETTPSNPNNTLSTKQYLKRVRRHLGNLAITIPASLVSSLLPPVIYFSLGYFPFYYLPVLISWLSLPSIAFVVVVYAVKDATSSSSLPSPRLMQAGQPREGSKIYIKDDGIESDKERMVSSILIPNEKLQTIPSFGYATKASASTIAS